MWRSISSTRSELRSATTGTEKRARLVNLTSGVLEASGRNRAEGEEYNIGECG